MGNEEMYDMLCKKCYVKIMKPSKRDIKRIIMSEENEKCECCGRIGPFVEYVEDGD